MKAIQQHRYGEPAGVLRFIDAENVRPVIDSEYPLEQAGEALNNVRYGHPGGKVVLTVAA